MSGETVRLIKSIDKELATSCLMMDSLETVDDGDTIDIHNANIVNENFTGVFEYAFWTYDSKKAPIRVFRWANSSDRWLIHFSIKESLERWQDGKLDL